MLHILPGKAKKEEPEESGELSFRVVYSSAVRSFHFEALLSVFQKCFHVPLVSEGSSFKKRKEAKQKQSASRWQSFSTCSDCINSSTAGFGCSKNIIVIAFLLKFPQLEFVVSWCKRCCGCYGWQIWPEQESNSEYGTFCVRKSSRCHMFCQQTTRFHQKDNKRRRLSTSCHIAGRKRKLGGEDGARRNADCGGNSRVPCAEWSCSGRLQSGLTFCSPLPRGKK